MGKKTSNNTSQYTESQILSMIENGSPLNHEMVEILDKKRIKELITTCIPQSIIDQAKKMNVDLVEKFASLIFTYQNTMTLRERLISTVAGIVGNVWANKYFERNGYSVENEVPILNEKGIKVTASDIVLTSKSTGIDFIELKTILAILSDANDYPFRPVEMVEDSDMLKSGSTISRENFVDLKRDTLPEIAVQTGEKVLEQLRKTREYIDRLPGDTERRVRLCVYRGTKISPDIKEKIQQYGDIIELPLDVDEIFNYSNMLVASIIHNGRNSIYPPKGEPSQRYEDRVGEEIPCLDL